MKKIAITIFTGSEGKQHCINTKYIQYIGSAGYMPVLITIENRDMLKECNGLLIPGGIDVDPIFYNDINSAAYSTNPERDTFEREMLHEAMSLGIPVFGICRGMQLIVRELTSMPFYQHINDHDQSDTKTKREHPSHFVTIVENFFGYEKGDMIAVNSMHHQGVIVGKEHVDPEIISGVCSFPTTSKSKQFVVEAINLNSSGMAVAGVQWHPEELMDTKLIKTFFE